MESRYLSRILVAGQGLFYISYLCIYILYTYAYLGCLISVTSGHRLWYFRDMSIISQFGEIKYLKYSLDSSVPLKMTMN